jgi:N-acetylglucosaminyldiphosphoundecaprenol N-acetyl-beta-D-mannosaminyltransferase
MKINKLFLAVVNYSELYDKIEIALKNQNYLTITYANANTLNLVYESYETNKIFQEFDIIHPDGTGIYLASKILYGKNGFKKRFTGSDFYPFLITKLIKKNYSIFFLGDTINTLSKIKRNYPGLNILGYDEGFNFNNDILLERINSLKPDILIVGMGSPKQEKWIMENKSKTEVKVFLAVGDGIKVFAGTKIRGPVFVQKLGLEWLVRLSSNPKYFWKRYILGIPLFFYRIFKYKFSKNI